jgi:hypothetical protein
MGLLSKLRSEHSQRTRSPVLTLRSPTLSLSAARAVSRLPLLTPPRKKRAAGAPASRRGKTASPRSCCRCRRRRGTSHAAAQSVGPPGGTGAKDESAPPSRRSAPRPFYVCQSRRSEVGAIRAPRAGCPCRNSNGDLVSSHARGSVSRGGEVGSPRPGAARHASAPKRPRSGPQRRRSRIRDQRPANPSDDQSAHLRIDSPQPTPPSSGTPRRGRFAAQATWEQDPTCPRRPPASVRVKLPVSIAVPRGPRMNPNLDSIPEVSLANSPSSPNF